MAIRLLSLVGPALLGMLGVLSESLGPWARRSAELSRGVVTVVALVRHSDAQLGYSRD